MSQHPGDPAPRWRAAATGILVILLFAVLAAWSGRLSPLARGPLLDGLAPTNYRWVHPPPELESGNEQPSSGTFPLALGPNGVEGSVVFTTDDQVTVIVAMNSIPPERGQDEVELVVTPLDPATLPPPGGGKSVFGNAYAIEASYRPSGAKVGAHDLSEPLDVILVYPSTSSSHASTHQLAYSADGRVWELIDSSDSAASQQVEGRLPGTGTVMVVGERAPVPAPAGDGGSATLVTSLLVAAGCLLLVGLALLIRSRRV